MKTTNVITCDEKMNDKAKDDHRLIIANKALNENQSYFWSFTLHE